MLGVQTVHCHWREIERSEDEKFVEELRTEIETWANFKRLDKPKIDSEDASTKNDLVCFLNFY